MAYFGGFEEDTCHLPYLLKIASFSIGKPSTDQCQIAGSGWLHLSL